VVRVPWSVLPWVFQRMVATAASASLALITWGSSAAPRAALLVTLVALLAVVPGHASLPVTDRDEARYVMATKQMLETGDFVDIRNQDLPRHKQPAGIYWLQALAVTLAGDGTDSPIGVYRLPSLFGAVAACVLAWWSFAPLVGPRAALLGAWLLGSTLLLGVEARIAKTDAMLLACTMLGTGVLVRAFLDPRAVGTSRLGYLFWVAIGLGAMIKGPVTLLVFVLGAAALSVLARSVHWLGALRPRTGIFIALAIALPWYAAIAVRTDGAFFATALGGNALGKVTDVHEGHGGPPGYYSALVWITFWPAAPILGATLGWIWANRRRREVLVLLSLVVPLWLVFEAVATKLPHYVLPAYPALAMLVALAAADRGALARGWWSRLITQGFWLLPAGTLGAGVGLSLWFEGHFPVLGVAVLLAAVGLGAVATAVSRRSAEATVPVAVAAALVTGLGAWPTVAALDTFWPSPRMAAAAARAASCPAPRLAAAGYSEPSFVFLTRTDTLLTEDGAEAADFLAAGGSLVEEIEAALGPVVPYEIVYVNDGSADGTEAAVRRAQKGRAHLRLLALDARSGKAEALLAGAAAARGELLVLIDGDGQNDPADIPRLLAAFDAAPGAGLAMAQRVGRQATAFKRWQSRTANAVRRRLLDDATRDAGCGFALISRELFRRLPAFAGMHRFLPALVRREGVDVVFVEVVDRPRHAGRSKYGFFDRLWVGITDTFGVLWLIRRRGRVASVREAMPAAD